MTRKSLREIERQVAALEEEHGPTAPELFLIVPPVAERGGEDAPDVELTADLRAALELERIAAPRGEGLELLTRADAASFRARLRAALQEHLSPASLVTVDEYLAFLGACRDPDRDADAATYFDALDPATLDRVWQATVQEAPS